MLFNIFVYFLYDNQPIKYGRNKVPTHNRNDVFLFGKAWIEVEPKYIINMRKYDITSGNTVIKA